MKSGKSDKSEFLLTFADSSQVEGLFKGPFLKGQREPRIAVVGRSNVGKSSLINALLKFKLAQVSSQPGKTRAIHFYHWRAADTIIADLPGYGYARASKDERDRWEKFIRIYFESDPNLEGVLLLLDARHGPTPADRDAIQFLRSKGVDITFIFVKSDTLKNQSERALRKREAALALESMGVAVNRVYWVSSHSEVGLKELVRGLKADFQERIPLTRGTDHA